MDAPDWNSLSPAPPGQAQQSDQQAPTEQTPDWNSLSSEPQDNTEEQIKAGAEGALQGAAGPFAVPIEKYFGVNPQDIARRQQQYPATHGLAEAGTLGASLFTGWGEVGLAAKALGAGADVLNVGKFGKIGSAVIKGALENGMIQGNDEVSNAMLGESDPETPVASALAHVGAAGLLGGTFGGAFGAAGKGLQSLGESKIGSKVGQFIEDFGNKIQFNKENPSLVDAVGTELSDFHNTTSAVADDVYGPQGLKAQAIDKLVPQTMTDAITNQNKQIFKTMQDKIGEMVTEADTYPSRLTKKLMNHVNDWSVAVNDPSATPSSVFNATQDLKQTLQAYSKFDKSVGPLSPEKDFISASKELQHGLLENLEDTSVWGKAGELQKGVNKAFTDFLPAQKDFLSRFTEKVGGDSVVSPGKVNTYVNQLGKPSAEIKQSMMKNYVNAAEAYRDKIGSLHEVLGVDNPIAPSSLNAVKTTLGEQTPGAQAADAFTKFINAKTGSQTGEAFGGIEGASAGYREGGIGGGVKGALAGAILGHLAPVIGRKTIGAVGSGALKVLSTGVAKGAMKTLDYAADVNSGAQRINSGISALFKAGGKQAVTEYANDKDKEKLKDYISSGQQNKEMDNSVQASPSPTPQQQSFAEGGEVLGQSLPEIKPADTKKTILEGTNSLANHYPTQGAMIQAAKSRINTYLTSIRPQPPKGALPFDTPLPNKDGERHYNKAIDIANDPLSILNKIKSGTITPDHVEHFKQLYPELHNHLSKKLIDKMGESKLDSDKVGKPTYRVRQGMGLFLGSPLDSTLTPQSMIAAQSVFQQQASQPAPNTPVQKSKRNTSKMGEMSKNLETNDQARAARANA
jgi:hypothetical protein